MRPGRVPWRGVAQEGSAQLVIALPVLAGKVIRPGQGGMAMDRVIIGVDPHKLSVTIEARDNREILRATLRCLGRRVVPQFAPMTGRCPERAKAPRCARST